MNFPLIASDKLTLLAKKLGITSWNNLLDYIKKLTYGRNSNRYDLSLILKEQKGSCSSKHAFLKTIADRNYIPNVKLILGIYKMNQINTNIGSILSENNLDYIPEAHCYLKIDGVRTDITSQNASFEKIEDVILKEIEILPNQIVNFKVDYHKNYLKQWIQQKNIFKSFEETWQIREQCISYLENNN